MTEPATGNERCGAVEAVSTALDDLIGLEEQPLAEHVARFDAAHSALTVALTSIDQV